VTGASVLLLGGARSGKSALAERMVEAHDGPLVYLATGEASDSDMAARLAAHISRRGPRWHTVETGLDLVDALDAVGEVPVLIDALGTWVARHDDFAVDVAALVAALHRRPAPTVVVSEEVGLGVHPSTAVGRRFRDALGDVNVAVAAAVEDVWLVVAGRVLPLSRSPHDPHGEPRG